MHISALSNKFVKDPREVVKAGDVVRVKVLEVDLARQRIALTMRLTDDAAPASKKDNAPMSVKAKATASSTTRSRRCHGGGVRQAEALTQRSGIVLI